MYGTQAVFYFQNMGTLTVSNVNTTNLNKAAYDMDTSQWTYVPTAAGVFQIDSFAYDSDFGDFTYTLSNLKFSSIYSQIGGAIYLSKSVTTTTYHPIYLTISNSTFQYSYSYTSGLIYSYDDRHYISISGCTFNGNTGINGEADMYFKYSKSMTVNNTVFKNFSSSVSTSTYGQSISIVMSMPYSLEVKFNNVTIQ